MLYSVGPVGQKCRVVAAVQASRMGKRTVLIEPGGHLGGITSCGLSAVDIGDPRSVGGIAREYFTRLVARYGKTLSWDQPLRRRGGYGPYRIGYEAIVPRRSECENLLVTFALFASHTAFSSIRMESAFMVTSQSAATAACMAIDDRVAVQRVDYDTLRKQLLTDGQILD